MLSCTCRSASVLRMACVRVLSFESILHDHHVLANNLQKIAEADRKFVSFEVTVSELFVIVA